MWKQCYLILYFFILPQLFHGQQVFPYQLPPKELAKLFTGAGDDEFIFSKNGKWIVHARSINYPSVNDIASPSIQVAGLYLNARNFAPAVQHFTGELTVKNLLTGEEKSIKGLPSYLRADHFSWSPDGKYLAFTQTSPNSVDLYSINLIQNIAVKVNKQPLNIALGNVYEWMPDNSLLYKIILKSHGQAPSKNLTPAGAFVFDTKMNNPVSAGYSGGPQSEFDLKTIDFYLNSQLVRNTAGNETRLGPASLYTDFSLSPDGNFILCSIIEKPLPMALSYSEFPLSVRVLHKNGKTIRELLNVPAGGWQKRPRNFDWRPDVPATVTWMQPIDTGSLKGKGLSTIYYAWDAPFAQSPKILFKTQLPLVSVTWSDHDFALVNEIDRRKGISVMSQYKEHTQQLVKILEEDANDFDNRLGMPVSADKGNGHKTLVSLDSGKTILINNVLGNASSNYLPFLAKYDPDTKALDFTWKGISKKESITQVGYAKDLAVVVRKNGESAGYEYYLQQLKKPLKKNYLLAAHKITPPFDSATSQVIQYKRSDGVLLAGTLFLPKGYDPIKNGRLPLFIWSYPRRFYSKGEYTAESATEKKYSLVIDTWEAPQMFVSQGYAVFEAGMPVLPDSTENANDRFIEQIVMNAEAAIQKLAGDGIADPQRVVVGGHSYGAFMTALLLANTHLFKAGIAMSGNYNCFQAPFGFQDETRSFWEAHEIYDKMSSIRYADKIKTPLLLIHGAQDDLPATLPQESANLFKAIQGNGGTVRYVSLPYESHGYRAKENILHLVWEMNGWMDKYVKNAQTK